MNLPLLHTPIRRAVLLAALAAGLFQTSFLLARQEVGQRPRLILVLAIDQMRFDYLTRFDDLYAGGLRTLIDNGAVFTNARYRHAATETGPGHSVILSGRHPSSSGIVANAWYDGLLGRTVNVVADPFESPLGGPGASASPVNFVGFTLGDALKQSTPESRVVGVSQKDRSAILMAGRLGDGAYWYETSGGNFITSTYYMDVSPAWLDEWNGRNVADRYARRPWDRLIEDEAVYQRYAGPDAIDGEWDRQDTVFPHQIRGNPPEQGFYSDLTRTPFVDELTLEVALEARAAHDLGTDGFTDILAVGFSGTDIVGHTYGARSQEVMDQLLRLDRVLENLFAEIDRSVGLEETLIVLTADHGSLPLIETLQARGVDARRIDPAILRDAVEGGLREGFGNATGFLASFGTRGIYLDAGAIADRGARRSDVEQVIIDALTSTGIVAAVYTQAQLAGDAGSEDPYIDLYRNGFFSSRSPHLSVRINPYIYLSSEFSGGTGHGTPYDYDRHIPIVLMGPGVRPGTFPAASGPEDIAPTLARILGLEYPREPDARILTEALRE